MTEGTSIDISMNESFMVSYFPLNNESRILGRKEPMKRRKAIFFRHLTEVSEKGVPVRDILMNKYAAINAQAAKISPVPRRLAISSFFCSYHISI